VAAGVIIPLVSGALAQRLGWQDQVKPEFAGGAEVELSAVGVDAAGLGSAELAAVDAGAVNLDLDGLGIEEPAIDIEDDFRSKARRAWLYTLGFARRLLLTIVISSAIGALIYGLIPEGVILRYAGGGSLLAVPLAALIGAPLYVNVAAVVPIIYSLSLKGMSHGAVLALLITATSISPPEILMLGAMFKKKYVATFVVATIIGAILTGYILNLVS